MVSSLRRVLAGAVVLIGVTNLASGSSASAGHLRARQWQWHTQDGNSDKGDGFEAGGDLEYEHGRRASSGPGGMPVPVQLPNGHDQPQQQRSLKSTQDPQCNLPEVLSCTLNLTAIGMVESGFATYHDDTCEASGHDGCFTEGVPACRTCYLSTDIYMAMTNTTEQSRPNWAMCPCCVPTTLEDNHVDIEVLAFNYTVFGISESACTDAPTPAPAPSQGGNTTSPPDAAPAQAPTQSANTTSSPAPSPTAAPATSEPVVAPTAAPMTAPTGEGAAATPAPEAGSRALGSPAPSEAATTDSTTETTPAPTMEASGASTSGTADTDDADDDGAANGAGTENLDTPDGHNGLSMGEKIGIGAGSAVGVIILGAAGFGVMKARAGPPS